MELTSTPQQFVHFIDFEALPLALTVMVLGLVSIRLIDRFFDNLGERFTDRRLWFKKGAAFARFGLYLLLAVVVLGSVLDLESDAIFALAGTIGLALGFAFKDLFASLMASIILLIDEPFQVGDRVRFGEYYGEVKEIGLRSVSLVTLDDNVVTIPNNRFLNEVVASANSGSLECMVVVELFVGAAEDVALARRLAAEAAATSRYIFLKKPVVTHVKDEFLGERFVSVISVKAYVFDARYETAFTTDVTERVKLAFHKHDIRAPDRQYRDLDLNGQETLVRS